MSYFLSDLLHCLKKTAVIISNIPSILLSYFTKKINTKIAALLNSQKLFKNHLHNLSFSKKKSNYFPVMKTIMAIIFDSYAVFISM